MIRHISYKFVLLLALTATALFTGACGDDDDNGGDDDNNNDSGGSSSAEVVDITEDEFEITTSPDSVPAGEVEFVVENIGDDTHEFVVIKTDLAEDELPLADEGGVDLESNDLEVIDEIDEVAPGDTEKLTVDLDSGDYVLICNIVAGTGAAAVSHYELGMHVAFTVD